MKLASRGCRLAGSRLAQKSPPHLSAFDRQARGDTRYGKLVMLLGEILYDMRRRTSTRPPPSGAFGAADARRQRPCRLSTTPNPRGATELLGFLAWAVA